MVFRWFVQPHFVRPSGFMYVQGDQHHHRDIMMRLYTGRNDDRYISPTDGKIKTLVVQSVDDILAGPANGTWKRTYIRNIVPLHYRLAMWPLNHIDMRENTHVDGGDWALIVGKWIVASVALTITVRLTSILLICTRS
jgi:hypothetical protein